MSPLLHWRLLLVWWSFSLMGGTKGFVISPHGSTARSNNVRRTSSTRQSLSTSSVPGNNINNDGSSSSMFDDDSKKYNVSLLLIDHYDSFTYNLYDMFAQLTVEPPQVIAKDAYSEWNPEDWKHIDGIILSPGPGTPQAQPSLCKQAINENPHLPILGVCLGHQLIALEYGATVDLAPIPIHGQDHWIHQSHQQQKNDAKDDSPSLSLSSLLFKGLPASFRVVRYHSLAASSLPTCLQVTATSKDDEVIQGIQHTEHPHYGVQFHPESIGTQHGMALLENFCRIVQERKFSRQTAERVNDDYDSESQTKQINVGEEDLVLTNGIVLTRTNGSETTKLSSMKEVADAPEERPARFKVMLHALPSSSSVNVKPLEVFEEFYSTESKAMWLDSSSYPNQGNLDILAAPTSKDDILEYHTGNNNNNNNNEAHDILTQLQHQLFGGDGKSPASNEICVLKSIETIGEPIVWTQDTMMHLTDAPPFDFRGGLLGYLGYEVRYDTQRFLQQQEHGKELLRNEEANSSTDDGIPTAAFFLARQSMVYHHPTQQWYLIGLVETENDSDNILEWMQSTCKRMLQLEEKELKTRNDMPASPSTTVEASATPPLAFVPNRPKETYEKNIDACHEYIRMGESYELCLTNQLEAKVPDSLSTLDLYRILRKRNPAPYAGYFRWNTDASESATTRPTSSSVTICCSSPERFMSIKRRQDHPEMPTILEAEAKPIKGTEARVLASNGVCRNDAESREDERRARSLELSLKNRAENLMIVDLLRNDLSRVCRVGSVHVAKLMGIESFATVHQMVSTIRGTLSDTATSIDLLRASFPGGSMTGAPKIRTMELLEDLEENVDRGPYAGSLGYLSVNGCMDMNIIIRSAIVTPTTDGSQKISIGAGGAITALSETQDEYDEMLLKARALVESAQEWAKSGNARTPALAPIEESDSSTLMETKSITTGQI